MSSCCGDLRQCSGKLCCSAQDAKPSSAAREPVFSGCDSMLQHNVGRSHAAGLKALTFSDGSLPGASSCICKHMPGDGEDERCKIKCRALAGSSNRCSCHRQLLSVPGAALTLALFAALHISMPLPQLKRPLRRLSPRMRSTTRAGNVNLCLCGPHDSIFPNLNLEASPKS